jgi:hypothetical protein
MNPLWLLHEPALRRWERAGSILVLVRDRNWNPVIGIQASA